MAEDARQIVPRRAHHPSLAIWCGGNELDGDDSTPVLAALREVVRELDPDRAWLPTSPLGDDGRARPVGAPGPAARTTSTTTRARRCSTASSASRG